MSTHILVVAHEPELRNELDELLHEQDFEIRSTADYHHASSDVAFTRPDILVIEDDLPAVSGWETCALMRRRHGIPSVVVGSLPTVEGWPQAVAVGAETYMRRPLSRLEITARIRAILRRYQLASRQNQSV
ncbi:response regulator transcription factor [Chloroflexota bacterium]